MSLHLITGGARSGKSRYAEALVERISNGQAVTYIATAEALDQEMTQRIGLHQTRRPPHWSTVERSSGIAAVLPRDGVVLLDCLTLLASNVFLRAVEQGAEVAREAVLEETGALVQAAQERGGDLVVVTNEVGFGIVPDNEYGRWFRDCLGEANTTVAQASDTVTLVVCGYALPIKTV